jgi:signal transduction histidine kinase
MAFSLLVVSAVAVLGSAVVLAEFTNALAETARAEARRAAGSVCDEIARIVRDSPGRTLVETTENPALRERLTSLSGEQGVILAFLVSPEGEIVSQTHCSKSVGRMAESQAEFLRGMACQTNFSIITAANARDLPPGLIPAERPIVRNGELLGYVRVVGMSEQMALGRIDALRSRIGISLLIMVSLVVGAAGMGVVLIYQGLTHEAALREQATAREQLAELGALASGLAHEIRNPLQSLSLQLDAAREDIAECADPALRSCVGSTLDQARTQIGKLDSLAAKFLQLATPREVELRPVDLAAIVESALATARPGLAAAGVQLETNLAPGITILGEPDDLRQSLANLLGSIAHTLEGCPTRRVTLSITSTAREATLVVEDSGPPIESASQSSVFHAFNPAANGRRCIGLSIARRLAERAGGRITAGTSSLGGARFETTFSRA